MKGTVLFISPSAYPVGGVATWLNYVCKGLKEKDWQVFVGLTSGRWHDVKIYGQKHACLPIIQINNSTGSREGRIRAIETIIKRVNPDLVVGVNIPDCYIAAARCRGTRSWPKTVMTIHAIQPDFYDDAKEYAALLDGVVCTNKLACELVNVDSGIDKRRIFYAPYGVTVHDKNNRSKVFGDPFRLAYVGRLEQHQKLVRDLPSICSHLEAAGIKYQLIVAGTGPDDAWIKREFEERRNEGIVDCLGAVEFHDMNDKVYDRADALIVTSAWETGPIIIWEAMASGVPVVTSQYVGSGLEKALTNNKNCLTFSIGDTRDAAACIMQLMEVGVREKLVQGGYHVVNTRYRQESSVEAWDRCFAKIMASQNENEIVKRSLKVTPRGRLDRVFGTRLGETVRSTFRRRFVHQSAGSEWPHSYGTRNLHDSSFWNLAQRLDTVAS